MPRKKLKKQQLKILVQTMQEREELRIKLEKGEERQKNLEMFVIAVQEQQKGRMEEMRLGAEKMAANNQKVKQILEEKADYIRKMKENCEKVLPCQSFEEKLIYQVMLVQVQNMEMRQEKMMREAEKMKSITFLPSDDDDEAGDNSPEKTEFKQ